MIVSNLALSLLLTLILHWSKASKPLDGLKIGAIIGILFALSVDLGYYSMTTVILNLSAIVVDTLAYALVTAITGLLIVLTWGKTE